MTLFLVRHGRPLVEPGVPPARWELDPAGFDDVWALRDRLPQGAAWFTSPEPKAVATVQLLTEGEVGVVDDLREHERGSTWVDDFEATVRRAFARPEESAHDGWEPIATCRDRVLRAVSTVLDVHHDQDVVLAGHGTAWTLMAAAWHGSDPDVDRWARLAMPDVIELPHRIGSGA